MRLFQKSVENRSEDKFVLAQKLFEIHADEGSTKRLWKMLRY